MKLLAISTGSVMLTLLALILSMFTFLFLYLPIAENKEFQADFGSELGSEILTCYLLLAGGRRRGASFAAGAPAAAPPPRT